jgi:ribulose-5-phosphate 4-epimerase/fuculose-1-phosphate aldolase
MKLTTFDETEASLRTDLAAIHRIFCIEGLNEGTWTHLSCRLGDSDCYLVSPANTHFSMVNASSLLLYDSGGHLLSGDGLANHDAVPIHKPIYDARPEARCILHFHSPYATSLTLLRDGRLNTRISQTAAYFHGKVSYMDRYAVPRTNTDEGRAMAEALGAKKVLFMKNHGLLIVSDSLADAAVSAYQLERACQQQIIATSTQKPFEEMEETYADQLAAEDNNGEPGYFDGMKRLLECNHPNYKL